MGKLYVVATPIGNLSDISKRALDVLAQVDLIICEDTRVAKKLLVSYEIKTPTWSYHEHSGQMKIQEIIKKLKQGENLALISDAGTPAISDPGNYLINQIIAEDIDAEIIPIPGPSALITALSVTALRNDTFLFLGFLPHKKGRQTMLKKIKETSDTVVIYESKHRILKLLTELKEVDKKVEVFRELTKIHETIYRSSLDETIKKITEHPEEQKGEFVVIIR
jgi:16S rRNA (cytidine1402-2'-O)-methyltransferase